MTPADNQSDLNLTTDTHSRVCCEDVRENWPRYNGTGLYILLCGSLSDTIRLWTSSDYRDDKTSTGYVTNGLW